MCLCNWFCKDINECWICLSKQNKKGISTGRTEWTLGTDKVGACSDNRWGISNSRGANIICICSKPWKNRSAAAAAPGEAGVRAGLCPRAPTPSSFQASTPNSESASLSPLYLSQGSRSSKAGVLQFSLCSLGSSAISSFFLCQKNTKTILTSTSHLQTSKIMFSCTLWRSLASRGQGILYCHFRLILKLCFLWVNT